MNKKRIIIGDPHGMYGILKQIIDKEDPADFIVLGDYMDSFNIYPEDCLEGLKKTLKLKDDYNITLLIGNHDAHYFNGWPDRCSGYQRSVAKEAAEVFGEALDSGKLRFSFVDESSKTIYTHAGISRTWFENWCQGSLGNIETVDFEAFRFRGADIYGDDPRNGPLWIRPNSLMSDPYIDNDGFVWDQVVGHTRTIAPSIMNITDTARLYVMDCITTHYLKEELDENGKVINRKICTK